MLDFPQKDSDSLLAIALAAAVPVWQHRLMKLPWQEVVAQIEGTPQALGERGDILLFGGGAPGEVADLFNRTAKAIAVLSFFPGGVTAFGGHWEAQHPGMRR